MSLSESALVVLVPEAEAVAKPLRDRYDPSAAAGMPAHITLLYPFKAPDEIDDITLGKLRSCFASFKPIQFSLSTIQRFPIAALYLAPQPDEPTRQLTLSIWKLLPEAPPYGGKGPPLFHIYRWHCWRTNSNSQLSPKTLRRHFKENCRSPPSRLG